MSSKLFGSLFLFFVFFSGCGSGPLDQEGLAGSDTALEQFTRAGQLYFRGRLTASLEEFNGVIYRYPDSPIAEDARLAVRRIESDLSGTEITEVSSEGPMAIEARIAVVGRPAASTGVSTAASMLRAAGASATEITDPQTPELTVVFHTSGAEQDASVVADSLERWLSRPETVNLRPGEELIEAVASGFDVLVILGDDAVFESFVN